MPLNQRPSLLRIASVRTWRRCSASYKRKKIESNGTSTQQRVKWFVLIYLVFAHWGFYCLGHVEVRREVNQWSQRHPYWWLPKLAWFWQGQRFVTIRPNLLFPSSSISPTPGRQTHQGYRRTTRIYSPCTTFVPKLLFPSLPHPLHTRLGSSTWQTQHLRIRIWQGSRLATTPTLTFGPCQGPPLQQHCLSFSNYYFLTCKSLVRFHLLPFLPYIYIYMYRPSSCMLCWIHLFFVIPDSHVGPAWSWSLKCFLFHDSLIPRCQIIHNTGNPQDFTWHLLALHANANKLELTPVHITSAFSFQLKPTRLAISFYFHHKRTPLVGGLCGIKISIFLSGYQLLSWSQNILRGWSVWL